MTRNELIHQVSAQQFAAFDTQLYLDTHPEDEMAMRMFKNYTNAYMALVKEYERQYGPLDSASATDGTWKWIDDPWPWEREAN